MIYRTPIKALSAPEKKRWLLSRRQSDLALVHPSPFAISHFPADDELDEVNAEIKAVQLNIEEVDKEIKATSDREMVKLMREEKNKLREKENKLREEKDKLLDPKEQQFREIIKQFGAYIGSLSSWTRDFRIRHIAHAILDKLKAIDLPSRNDERFAHLHELPRLQVAVGQAIKLPLFPELPKGFTAAIAEKVLLTPARLALLVEVEKTLHIGQSSIPNNSPDSGLILSGPNGVGKSVDSYLLASFLYVAGCIVAYIVRILSLVCSLILDSHDVRCGPLIRFLLAISRHAFCSSIWRYY